MPLPESEEVDAFGRAINRSRRFEPMRADLDRGNGRGDGFAQRGRIDARNRARSRSRSPLGRRDARGFPAPGVGPSAAERGSFHDSYRQQLPPHPPLPPPFFGGPEQAPVLEPPSTSLLPPLASYKSFIMTQPEGLAPEVYQKMYEQYHFSYLEELSEAFFRVSMSEEWFQDRYNPINIVNLEQETADWAVNESLVIKNALEKHGSAFVQACSLEPSANVRSASSRHSNAASKQPAPPQSSAQTEEKDAEEENESVVAGRLFDGHGQRTVYIPGVHACCPKAVFRSVVTAALAPAGDEAQDSAVLPDRVLISHPVWSQRALERFERSAWVVFPSVRAARRGLDILKGLQVKVPGPVDAKGEPTVAFQFTVQAMMHNPRPAHVLPEHMSSSRRLRADLVRALEIAALLDAERNLPGDQRLQSLLAAAGPLSVVQRLDVTIAYLRRVHLVAYYSGKRFRDEAHLLAQAPSPTFRSAAAPEDTLTPQAADSDLAGLEAVHAALSSAEREDEEKEKDKVQEEREAEEEAEAEERDREDDRSPSEQPPQIATTVAVASSSSASSASSSTSDRRIDALLKALQSPAPSVDQSDAADLKALLDKTFEGLVRARCKFEDDGKCRCCFEYCKKLFKAYDFLAKHMRGKHPEFGLEQSLRHAEGYMRRRYQAEPLPARPLPPVEVEGPFGRIEYRSVTDVLQRATAHSSVALPAHGRDGGAGMGGSRGGDRWSGADREHRGDRRGSGAHERGYGRGNEEEHFRRGGAANTAHSNSSQPPQTSTVPGTLPLAAVTGAKRMPTYLDVDVPKESVVSVDYGVSIAPPVKRRRGAVSAAASTTSLASGVGAASEAVPTTTSLS